MEDGTVLRYLYGSMDYNHGRWSFFLSEYD
jgi:hypothetical protein